MYFQREQVLEYEATLAKAENKIHKYKDQIYSDLKNTIQLLKWNRLLSLIPFCDPVDLPLEGKFPGGISEIPMVPGIVSVNTDDDQ